MMRKYCETCRYRLTVGVDSFRCEITGKALKWFTPACSMHEDKEERKSYAYDGQTFYTE